MTRPDGQSQKTRSATAPGRGPGGDQWEPGGRGGELPEGET